MIGFVIYKATNLKNGKVYIGATIKDAEQRKKDHLLKAKSSSNLKFHKAISTYGAEAFKWSQIDTAVNNDDLAQKEKEYILKYNSKEDGYNSDEGGGIQKTVYQYDIINGRLLHKYSNLTDAGNAINATKQDLSKVCLSVGKFYKGFYWSYDYVDKFIPQKDYRRKSVSKYTIDDNLFIKKYNSIIEAHKDTGVNKSCIAKVCRKERKTAGGFIWKYN